MSPRPYRAEKRRAASEETRARIIAAARDLLMSDRGLAGFSIDCVARQAGVARMTVYYQFRSKLGLLEAIFDHLAQRGLVQRLLPALAEPDPLEALNGLIAAFGAFWSSDRIVIRRLRAFTAFDTVFEQGIRERDERRREHLRGILRRLAERYGRPSLETLDETAGLLQTLTNFQTFDSLAGEDRDPEEVTPQVQRLARAILGLNDQRAAGAR